MYTGSKVKTIKENLDNIMKSSKLLSFDYLQIYESKYILLAGKNEYSIWKLTFQDLNERSSIDEMLKEKENFLKLMIT